MMMKSVFESHLKELTPHLESVVKSVMYKRYFNIYGADDLLQEVLKALWLKVPRSYSKKKGSLKKYCQCAARNILNAIANREYRHTAERRLDFNYVDDAYSDDGRYTDQTALANAVNKTMRTVTNREAIIFKAKLESLAKRYKHWRIIYAIYRNDGDRAKTCKELDISDSMITKTFKIVKHNERVLTAGSRKILEYMENGVNIFAPSRVY